MKECTWGPVHSYICIVGLIMDMDMDMCMDICIDMCTSIQTGNVYAHAHMYHTYVCMHMCACLRFSSVIAPWGVALVETDTEKGLLAVMLLLEALALASVQD